MQNLSNTALRAAYKFAKDEGLDKEFIKQLKSEIKRRGI